MLSIKRINKIKKELLKKNGDISYTKFIISSKDGLYMVDLSNQINKYTKIDSTIKGYNVEDLQEFTIEHILVCGDGSCEPVIITDDIPEDIGGLNDMLNSYPEEVQSSVLREALKQMDTEKLKIIAADAEKRV